MKRLLITLTAVIASTLIILCILCGCEKTQAPSGVSPSENGSEEQADGSQTEGNESENVPLSEEEIAARKERIENLKSGYTSTGLEVKELDGGNAIEVTTTNGVTLIHGGKWVSFEEAKDFPVPDFADKVFLATAMRNDGEILIELENVTSKEIKAYIEKAKKGGYGIDVIDSESADGVIDFFGQSNSGRTLNITYTPEQKTSVLMVYGQ